MTLIGAFGIDQAFGKTAIVARVDLAESEGKEYITYQKIITTEPRDHHLEKFQRAKEISEQINDFMSDVFLRHADQETQWCFAIEGLSHGSFGKAAAANRDLAGLQFVVVNSLEHFDDNKSFIIPPKSLKKFATGSGTASKDDMVNFIEGHNIHFYEYILMATPKSRGRYDLADAYWLAEMAYSQCESLLKEA